MLSHALLYLVDKILRENTVTVEKEKNISAASQCTEVQLRAPSLAAAEQGLGSCWICNFDADKASGLFNLPENLEPAVLIPIGYSATENTRDKSRKALSEIAETL